MNATEKLFQSLAYIIDTLLNLYFWVIFLRAILSWFNPNPFNPFVRTIYRLVDPITHKISKFIPTRFGMIDISPFILMLIVMFLQKFIVKALYDLARGI